MCEDLNAILKRWSFVLNTMRCHVIFSAGERHVSFSFLKRVKSEGDVILALKMFILELRRSYQYIHRYSTGILAP